MGAFARLLLLKVTALGQVKMVATRKARRPWMHGQSFQKRGRYEIQSARLDVATPLRSLLLGLGSQEEGNSSSRIT